MSALTTLGSGSADRLISVGTVLEWVRDAAGGNTGGLVGDVTVPAVILPGSTLVGAVDDLFRGDQLLRCVVLEGAEGPVLVDRSSFEATVTGRLGYGRLLHARMAVAELVLEETLVLSYDCTIGAAASAVIARRSPASAANSVVVLWPGGGVGVAHVPSIFERLARQYAYQAWHDPLTRLPNRQYLMDQIQLREEPAASAAGDWQAVFFYIDLDRFKDVNDQFGHAAGDQVLVQFADRLRSSARAGDVVVRLGGDEFAILTADLLTVAESSALAARLVLAAAAPFVVKSADVLGEVTEQIVTIGASVGVAHSGRDQPSLVVTSLEALLKQADLAMYRAKDHGRGRSAQYDPQMSAGLGSTEEKRARRAMERRLRRAIEQRGLTIHYQPVVNLLTGRVSGVEALARWDDPALGKVPSDEFITLAETTGLILDLGQWVLRTACRQAAEAPAPGVDPELTFAVNVSPIQLAQPGFVEVVSRALADSGLPARRLCLEVTETAAISDLPRTTAVLSELRRCGVQIALDDFGTGHSSLTMLRTLPVTIVKIDRSFVENVAHSAKDAVLVRLVIETAHALGLEVCAEGVEDSDQAHKLLAMGCDTAQGWYYGRPEPPGAQLSRALSRLVETAAAPS